VIGISIFPPKDTAFGKRRILSLKIGTISGENYSRRYLRSIFLVISVILRY